MMTLGSSLLQSKVFWSAAKALGVVTDATDDDSS